MSDPARTIKEHLARARGYFHNHDVLRAILSMAAGLKQLVESQVFGVARMEIGSLVVEMTQNLNRTDEVKRHLPEGLEYAKGKEKRLLVGLIKVIKGIKEDAAHETPEQIRERKLKLDRALIRGQKLLDSGKPGEAEAAFQEALTFYVNEHKVFGYIAVKLLKVDLARQAIKYLRQALEKDGDDPQPYLKTAEAHLKLQEPDKAEAILNTAMERFADDPEVYSLIAQTLEAKGQFKEALAAAEKALSIEPALPSAKKARARLAKKIAAA